MRNEGFDQISAGILDRFGTAEMGSVSFDQIGIEVVLADQEAELIAEPRMVATVVTVTVARDRAARDSVEQMSLVLATSRVPRQSRVRCHRLCAGPD